MPQRKRAKEEDEDDLEEEEQEEEEEEQEDEEENDEVPSLALSFLDHVMAQRGRARTEAEDEDPYCLTPWPDEVDIDAVCSLLIDFSMQLKYSPLVSAQRNLQRHKDTIMSNLRARPEQRDEVVACLPRYRSYRYKSDSEFVDDLIQELRHA